MPRMPPHFALNFDRGAELSPALRREVTHHRWEVAGPHAYPWLVAIDSDLVGRPPSAKEVRLGEAIALALAHLVAEKTSLAKAFDGGEPLTRAVLVNTHAGELEVTLRAPYKGRTRARAAVPEDVIAALLTLETDDLELDDDRRVELEEVLIGRFAESPEASGLGGVRWPQVIMDLAADTMGITIASFSALNLRDLLLKHFPSAVNVDPRAAGEIVSECRAFFLYLKREHSLKDADACLRVLDHPAGNSPGKTTRRLEAALSAPESLGAAKAIMMAGAAAGFDMSSKAGIEAWMREIQGKPLPSSIHLPFGSASASKPGMSKKKKTKSPKRKH